MYYSIHTDTRTHACMHTHSLTSELQAPQLKGDKAIAILNDVHESIEPVGGKDEEVSTGNLPPASQHQVPTQVLLQHPRQVLIVEAVQPVWIRV